MTADFGWLAGVDASVAAAVARHATRGLSAFMEAISLWHGPRVVTAVAAVVALLLWVERERAGALWLLVTVFGGAGVNHLLKHSIQRPRPGLENLGAAATDFSFPSGHAANATLLYGALAVLVFRHTRSPWARGAAVAGAVLMILLVGSSRLVLGAHHFSDVVAGVLMGAAWLALTTVTRTVLQR